MTNRIQHLLAVNSNPLEGELGIVVRKDERPYLVRDPQERPYILPLGEKKQIEKEFDLDQIPLVRPPLTYLRVEAMNGRQHRRQIRVFYSMDGTHTPFMRLEKGEPQRVWQDSDGNDYYLTWDDDMSKHDTGS